MASSGSEVPSRTTERRSGKLRDRVERLLAVADVRVDGERPWDIQVNDDEFFERALTDGALGLGESYMDGWWECERLDEFICRILEARLETRVRPAKELWWVAKARLFNLQKRSRAFQVGRRHYDIGNELYQRMLDRRMTYSCGYWRDARTLDEAQEAKLDLVCRKLYVEPGMRVLDIGCGWGAMAKFAAERYGAEVVGITVSEEQAKLAREVCRGLPV